MNLVREVRVTADDGFTLFPLSCIHWPLTSKKMLDRWLEAVTDTPNSQVLLLGDQFEGTRTSYRAFLRGYAKDTNSKQTFDTLMEAQVDELVGKLEPIKDKIIGVIQGNHYYEFFGDLTSDQLLCHRLKVPFLGVEAGIRLECRDKSGKSRATLLLAAHHHGGSSGGKTFGGDINALHKFEQVWDADIFCLGHTHKTLTFMSGQKTIPRQGDVTEGLRKRVFLRCGCMRDHSPEVAEAAVAYNPDYAKMDSYAPIPLSWPELKVQVDFRTGEPRYTRTVVEP